jgi:TonB family protein
MTRRSLGPALLLSLLAAGCAYYNTFFHARQSYEQAERAREAAPADQRHTIGLDLYEQAMKRCAKVILEYPDSRWVDDAILLMGKCFYAREDYLGAFRKFDELLLYYESSNLARDARFWKAKTLVALERYDEAVPALQKFREGKKDDLRRQAIYLLALVEHQRGNHEGAAEGLELYLAESKKGPERGEVLRRLGDSYRRTEKSDRALRAYGEYLKDPLLESDLRLATELEIVDLLVEGKRFGEAYRLLDDLAEEAERPDDSLRIAFGRGKALMEEEKTDEAIEFLRSALVEAPSTESAGAIAWLLGETYLDVYDNKDSAAAAYRKAAALPGPEERRAAATARAKDLDEYLGLRGEIDGGEADTARAFFLLAEHELFTFGESDLARARYRSVAERFPTSSFAPRALAAEAYLFERDGNTGLERDSLLLSLVRSYPKSSEAVEVLDRGTIAVEPDSLAIWIARYEEAHPETGSGEERATGFEGEVAFDSDPIGPLEGPPAPLRIDRRVEPAYPIVPPGREGIEGSAEIEVEVGGDGKVENARVLRSSDALFEGPALAAAYQCRFIPETIEGTRTTNLRFEFRPSPR